jgi:hypothetical protein
VEARIQEQVAQLLAERTAESQCRFYMDYGFRRASSLNYSLPNKKINRVVLSFDGFFFYLLNVDEATHYIWCFLTKTKEPLIDLLDTFFSHFGHELVGSVHTNQGGELACSGPLTNFLLWIHWYVLKPTGADSPSQNGAVKVYNGNLAVCTRTLLYDSGLPAKYWSSAPLQYSDSPLRLRPTRQVLVVRPTPLCILAQLPLAHATTKKTPFEVYFRICPNLVHLKLFGS